MQYGWPKERRVTKHAEYTACYNAGERQYTKLFVIFIKQADPLASGGTTSNDFCGQTAGRIGMAVSRKNGNAVARNRIKRVLREFFRLHQEKIPCADVVIVPKKHLNADAINLATVEKDLLPFFLRLDGRKTLGTNSPAV